MNKQYTEAELIIKFITYVNKNKDSKAINALSNFQTKDYRKDLILLLDNSKSIKNLNKSIQQLNKIVEDKDKSIKQLKQICININKVNAKKCEIFSEVCLFKANIATILLRESWDELLQIARKQQMQVLKHIVQDILEYRYIKRVVNITRQPMQKEPNFTNSTKNILINLKENIKYQESVNQFLIQIFNDLFKQKKLNISYAKKILSKKCMQEIEHFCEYIKSLIKLMQQNEGKYRHKVRQMCSFMGLKIKSEEHYQLEGILDIIIENKDRYLIKNQDQLVAPPQRYILAEQEQLGKNMINLLQEIDIEGHQQFKPILEANVFHGFKLIALKLKQDEEVFKVQKQSLDEFRNNQSYAKYKLQAINFQIKNRNKVSSISAVTSFNQFIDIFEQNVSSHLKEYDRVVQALRKKISHLPTIQTKIQQQQPECDDEKEKPANHNELMSKITALQMQNKQLRQDLGEMSKIENRHNKQNQLLMHKIRISESVKKSSMINVPFLNHTKEEEQLQQKLEELRTQVEELNKNLRQKQDSLTINLSRLQKFTAKQKQREEYIVKLLNYQKEQERNITIVMASLKKQLQLTAMKQWEQKLVATMTSTKQLELRVKQREQKLAGVMGALKQREQQVLKWKQKYTNACRDIDDLTHQLDLLNTMLEQKDPIKTQISRLSKSFLQNRKSISVEEPSSIQPSNLKEIILQKSETQNKRKKQEIYDKEKEQNIEKYRQLELQMKQKIAEYQLRTIDIQQKLSEAERKCIQIGRERDDFQSNYDQLKKQKSSLDNKIKELEARIVIHSPQHISNIHLFPPGFIFEPYQYEERLFLIQNLVNYVGTIRSTRLLYRADNYNKTNFHKYIDNHKHIVLIIKTIYGKLIAGYSEEAFDPTRTKRGYGMILPLWSRRVFLNKDRRAISYDDYFMIFGNSELRIKSLEFTLFSNFGISNAYYDSKGEKVNVLLGEDRERQVGIAEYEFWTLDVDE